MAMPQWWRGIEPMTDEQCRDAVIDALDLLPSEISSKLTNVAVIVEDRHPDGLMGIYDPSGGLQRIVIFREANPTPQEVKRTVLHEVGHHFGMREAEISELGFG
jgi:predicted Zn-dependent protease with MMP-like domain